VKNLRRLVSLSAALAAATALLLGIPSCSDSTAPPPAQTTPDTEGVIYAGAATDEALEALLLAAPQNNAAQSVAVDAPLEGAVMPKDVPPTITWHVGGGMGATLREIGEWLGPRKAFAHGAPVNGRAYFLVFASKANPKAVRVFTTNLEYTFDAATWAKLALESGPITLTITNAIFEENRVAQDGGPFPGQASTFSIGP
jgi:hypothetical protein